MNEVILYGNIAVPRWAAYQHIESLGYDRKQTVYMQNVFCFKKPVEAEPWTLGGHMLGESKVWEMLNAH